MKSLYKLPIEISRYQACLDLQIGLLKSRRLLYCLLVLLISYHFIQPSLSFASSLYVTQKFRYHLRDAGEVFLVWGINGWKTLPEQKRPPGTTIKFEVKYTPMIHKDDTFVIEVRVPSGATIDYGFLITKKHDGTIIEAIWDGSNQEYHMTVKQDGLTEVEAPFSLKTRELSSLLKTGLRLLLVGCFVAAVGVILMSAPQKRNSRIVTFVLLSLTVFGLILRLHAAWDWNSHHLNSPERLVGDEPGYDDLARGLLEGYGFHWPGRVPLYPLWLAGIYLITNGSYNAVAYVQALLGAVVIPLTYMLGHRAFGLRAGLIAAFLAAISFVLISQSLHLLSEILFTPLVLLVAITLWDAFRKLTSWCFLLAGFWTGVSALVRPTLLFFPFAALLLFYVVLRRRQVIRYWAIYVLVVMLVIMPWIIRNYVRYQAVFPLQTSNAILWQGSPEYYHLIHDEGYTYLEIWYSVLRGSRWAEAHDPTSVEGDRWWTKRALRSIAAEPLIYLRYAVIKVGTFWVGDPNADWGDTFIFNFQALRRLGYKPWDAIQLFVARVLPILALLAAFTVRHRWRRFMPLYGLLLYATLLHAATHAEARLSEPFQPFLLVFISGAVVTRWGVRIQNAGYRFWESFRLPLRTNKLVYLRDLLHELVVRDMKLRYKRSVLGLAWSLLNPLAQLLVFIFVFSVVLPLNIPNYPLFVFAGLLVWTWFQSALFQAADSIVANPDLIRRPGFPMPVLPVVTITTHLIHFLLAVPILLLILLWSQSPISTALLFFPALIMLQFLLTLSLSYIMAALQVIFRDIQYLLGIILTLTFFMTPIFYDASAIPETYRPLYYLNPMVHLVTAYRAIFLYGEIPNLLPLLVIGVTSIGLLYVSYTIFVRTSYRFVEEL